MSALLRQATLLFYSSGRIDANRPGPRPKHPTTLSAAASAALIYAVEAAQVKQGEGSKSKGEESIEESSDDEEEL